MYDHVSKETYHASKETYHTHKPLIHSLSNHGWGCRPRRDSSLFDSRCSSFRVGCVKKWSSVRRKLFWRKRVLSPGCTPRPWKEVMYGQLVTHNVRAVSNARGTGSYLGGR